MGRFCSPAEFAPHAMWLAAGMPMKPNGARDCGCKYCSKRSQKEIIRWMREKSGLPTHSDVDDEGEGGEGDHGGSGTGSRRQGMGRGDGVSRRRRRSRPARAPSPDPVILVKDYSALSSGGPVRRRPINREERLPSPSVSVSTSHNTFSTPKRTPAPISAYRHPFFTPKRTPTPISARHSHGSGGRGAEDLARLYNDALSSSPTRRPL